MERTSRCKTLFESLEKLNSQKSNPKTVVEDLQQYRYISSKLLQCVNTQDKLTKDHVIKCGAYVESILTALEISNDKTVSLNLILLISELLGKSQIGKRANNFITRGVTQILFHVLTEEYKEQSPSEELLIAVHQVLGRIGPKDRKFGLKARLGQALPITLTLIRNHITGYKVLQPLLLVLKLYAANAVNASYLGKNGAVTYLFKILTVCGRKHLTLLKYALDTLTMLVKSKSNSARAVGQGGVPILLTMFFEWHRSDTKNRHVNLRKAVLMVLKNITNLKSGRKTLIEADGIRILYNTCMESIESRELESVIFTASLIMRRCFPRNRLPLQTVKSPLNMSLPESDFHKLDPCPEGSHVRSTNEEEDDSSLDNDDDISSEDDRKEPKLDEEEIDPAEFYSRTPQDLQMYEKFFPEILELEDDSDEDEDNQDYPVVMPTGSSSENSFHTKHHCAVVGSQSATEISNRQRYSAPTLPTFYKDLVYCDDSSRRRPCSANSNNISDTALAGLKNSLVITSFSSKTSRSNGMQRSVSAKPSSSSSYLDNKQNAKRKTTGKSLKASAARRKNVGSSTNKRLEESSSVDNTSDGAGADGTMDDIYNDDASDDYNDTIENPDRFLNIASQTKSVGRFNKISYPDLFGSKPPPYAEQLIDRKYGVQRVKIFEDIDRMINPEHIIDKVVYDLDSVVKSAGDMYNTNFSNLSNRDEQRLGRSNDYSTSLKFNSQFESGNLRKVIQVRAMEYDLILSPDINTNHHHQWFYFEVSNMEAGVKYRFNIVNCEKPNSQFNFGMQPVIYSVVEAVAGRPYWKRFGTEICYYKNHFIRSSQTTGGVSGKTYYTTTFTVKFKHEKDVCYIAYHYPYTYSMLQADLDHWENSHDSSQFLFRRQKLTQTLSGNPVPVLTITSHSKDIADKNRPYIFLTSRVHPGESNASWVMKGTIQHLLSDRPSAQSLRDMYVFKIVPMLNPDGVINGNHRTSLTAEDLNRRWLQPCPTLHPTIYHTKGLMQHMTVTGKAPLVYCDYHGHSRKKNVFLYGCSPFQSWLPEDSDNPTYLGPKLEDQSYKHLPKMLNQVAPSFALTNCNYIIEKNKESTARVVVWRQMGIIRSYTMESTYAGCDIGPYRGSHISTKELEEMGRKFCDGLHKMTIRMKPTTTNGSTLPITVNIPSESSTKESTETDVSLSAAETAACSCNQNEEESVTEDSELDDDDEDDEDLEDDDEDEIDEEEDDDDNAF
ncbi:cytosolic carboxypeptidase 1-like isoform X2 [Tubulanus polymorphus]|uniref:cytosolic carboxypeptidase 1-like isoform X2 n=1 Tax=Tubulanus polymorphus TaxID=672921 RepID=UPI003DA46D39